MKFKKKVCEILKRNKGKGIEWVIKKLNKFTVGYINYYGGSMQTFMNVCNGWIRRKIRTYIIEAMEKGN
ncbi:MAG: group II intron maturase-specific domain-containing protein [Lachnospirales bacterium]